MIRKSAVTVSAAFALLAATPTGAWADPVPTPQMSLIQGTLNKPCLGIGKPGLQSLIALINVGVQDVPVLSAQQQCTDNSTINDGDDALSHILDEIPVLSGNG
ncbi:rodlin [Streptomyces mirabilis]|uniref:rodlin n=1 Tax=Streptomyces mirabilis TaxID=68239 RepID=UPI0035E33322